ncbi:unnamed protein product [Kluyveromyces dobzhanskii CBS 2104]|uniref:WGS project CCBQ000000000 data, contig 00058 n=1 Tax=Kluyveromyces dobzhanskii CBS 2104 TaxID=1427455 RepID=A0A0A8LBI9_9SACH|nr:unnamed protein product [Kluyveromyces dobzhanskii CBS 2104]
MSKPKSHLKRSTVILDDKMVREYKLAVEKLTPEDKDQVTNRSDSSKSISSLMSMDSVLSRDSSIMDLLLEEQILEEESDMEVIFLTKDNVSDEGDWNLWEAETYVLSRTPLEFQA